MRTDKILFILFLLTILVLFFVPGFDPDFGWHLRCGELLVSGTPCVSNTFTYYLADYQSYYATFGFDLILYLGHNTFGFLFSPIFYAILMTSLGFLMARLARFSKEVFYLLFVLAVFLSQTVFSIG